MIILDVNKLSKDFGYGRLFDSVSFSLNEGESIAIVGPNGCGKSTILKMIMGLVKIDNGTINIKKGAKVAYLDQTGSSIDDDRCVYEILNSAFVELNLLQEKIKTLPLYDVWCEYLRRQNLSDDYLSEIKEYEKEVLSKR